MGVYGCYFDGFEDDYVSCSPSWWSDTWVFIVVLTDIHSSRRNGPNPNVARQMQEERAAAGRANPPRGGAPAANE